MAKVRWLLLFTLVTFGPVLGAQVKPDVFTPVLKKGQLPRGPDAANLGAVGVDGKSTEKGFVLDFVAPNGPAEKGGIRVGDMLVSIGGETLPPGLRKAGFYELLLEHKTGDRVQFVYRRNNEEHEVDLVFEPLVKFDPARIWKAIIRAAESIGGFQRDFLPGINDSIFAT